MITDDNKNWCWLARLIREKGVYLALLGCMLLLGGTAFLIWPREPEPAPAENVSESRDETLAGLTTLSPSPSPLSTPSPSPSPSPTRAPLPDFTPVPPAATAPPAPEKASAPLSGTVQWGFAANELIYSKSLDQWMAHAGVDISGSLGDEVRTPWSGVVDEVSSGGALGVTVRIEHGDGMVSVYANLAPEPPVHEGQRLTAGTVIGLVGKTAPAEAADSPHLHFEVLKDGKAVDPNEYVLIRKQES